jgi:hypothetical protein
MMVGVVIVVMVVPVPVGMPTVLIFVPPSVVFLPAALPCLMQFMPPVVCLLTLRSMVRNGFMQIMVGMFDSLLAIIVSSERLYAGEKQSTGKR